MKITLSKTIKKHANDINPMAHNEIFKNDIRVRNNHSYEEFSNTSFNANANLNPYLIDRCKFYFL
ncbi:hypothetical protein HpMMM21_12190 [Helicobacter pylori]